ncbi:DUF2515 family protein [Oceanobacillus damuensis]|uniref:DUF2515 family protein n=1 Tax=Oceanobacillus damuensis TaxID=937928 RepID=UPI00082FDC1D|nr:DUF2515 family protein [Oceanobacillus damuensis]
MSNKKSDYLLHYITNSVTSHNVDNISRTKAYQNYFIRHPEIKWSLVASIVSRNAGWNMTDLYLPPFQGLLSKKERTRLFMTYERANWLIFSDAYPQLLTYSVSKEYNKPFFHLLPEFGVSAFMTDEWHRFWKLKDMERLLTSLIINEQNLIQSPVIDQSFFKTQVFGSFPYILQNLLFMNAVLLPDRKGNLHGVFVHDFTNVDKRIEAGKKIAALLDRQDIHEGILDFMLSVEPTGSRLEYEGFIKLNVPVSASLRNLYPIITHQDIIRNDWFENRGIRKKWQQKVKVSSRKEIGRSFYNKRKLLFAYYYLKRLCKKDLL